MKLGDAKRKVNMLLDEYSSGGEIMLDEDIMLKMNDFFDMAQKDMATWQRIVRATTVEAKEWTQLPSDFIEYVRVWKDGKPYHTFPIVRGKMFCPNETGALTIEYIAEPTTITKDTPDTYEFEVREDAANALPFYVAAQQLITDLVIDYAALWEMYQLHKSSVSKNLPSGGFGRVRQALYG